MEKRSWEQTAQFISNTLRLRTLPIGVAFLKDPSEFPEKTRRPSEVFGKKITICQGITLARVYGWTTGLTADDLICLPALLAFGLTSTPDPAEAMESLFCDLTFAQNKEMAKVEVEAIHRFQNGEYKAILMAPLQKGLFEPDTILFYGNPAQMMRIIQSMTFANAGRIPGNFGGKVECTEYLIAPFKSGAPRISVPGMGDRIFSMTQDDEMVFSLPGVMAESLVHGLSESGKAIGARYPVTFYQNFQPEFPRQHIELGKKLGIF
jgi:uncharacterized protein (DUF169 family)